MTSKVIASSVLLFTYISPDDLDNGVTGEADYKIRSSQHPRPSMPHSRPRSMFGSDPVCTAYTDKVRGGGGRYTPTRGPARRSDRRVSPGPWLRLVTVVAWRPALVAVGTSCAVERASAFLPRAARTLRSPPALATSFGRLSTAQHYLGIRRDGSIAWREPRRVRNWTWRRVPNCRPDVIPTAAGMQATNDPSVGTPRPTKALLMGRAGSPLRLQSRRP